MNDYMITLGSRMVDTDRLHDRVRDELMDRGIYWQSWIQPSPIGGNEAVFVVEGEHRDAANDAVRITMAALASDACAESPTAHEQ